MNQKTKLSYLSVIVLSLVFGFASLVAVAKNDNAKASQGKSKTVNTKNFEKADTAKGTTNAQLHKEKSEEVTKTLKEEAKKQKDAGNTEVGDQIQQVVTEQEQTQEETTDAIAEVESRGKIKTFLVGTDYKNLGQLRSSLVHNRNEIRKLTQSLALVQTPEEKALIEAQLLTLTQERERIKTVITTNESSFSLFGWVSRFLTNYEQTPINETEETQLTTEVETAIETADATVPVVPVTTTETVPVTPAE
jgi:hypothetical protein